MDIQFKKIGSVTFGSFGISIAIIVIALIASLPFNAIDQMSDILLGEWSTTIIIVIAAIAFPFMWRYLKVE